MELSLIGLIVLVLGWIIQLIHSWKNNHEIRQWFLIFYMVGVGLLVIDGFQNNLKELAILNLVSLIVAGLILLRLKFRKK
ncbi:MAG: hypothetical protein PHE43_00875 [Candidatus Nanoarchaeia archaeon]|nr:hypothetical protein [Candidatus Nanoarchaeia archaeon]